MVATVTPEQLGKRVLDYTRLLSYGGMSAACQSALRPARKLANTKNFGFTDRTGDTRKKIGPVRRYKISTARRKHGGGAYFRGGPFPAGPVLEYRFGGQYQYLSPAVDQTGPQQLREFVRQGEKEVDKAIVRARAGRSN